MNPFKGIISQYKSACPDMKGLISICIYLHTNIYALTLILKYSNIIREICSQTALQLCLVETEIKVPKKCTEPCAAL